MALWSSTPVSVAISIFLLFTACAGLPQENREDSVLCIGEGNCTNLKVTDDHFTLGTDPPRAFNLEVRYVRNGVPFLEQDFYLAFIHAIAEEACRNIHALETRTKWINYPGVGIDFKPVVERESQIPLLNTRLALWTFERLARTMSLQNQLLADAFFYPKAAHQKLGAGRLYHTPTTMIDSPKSNASSLIRLNTSVPSLSTSFNLRIVIDYNPQDRQFLHRDIYWAIIEGIMAIAPIAVDTPCKSIRRYQSGFTIAMFPERRYRGLFIYGIATHIFKGLADAIAREQPHGWFGELVFQVYKDHVMVGRGYLKAGNHVTVADGTDMSII